MTSARRASFALVGAVVAAGCRREGQVEARTELNLPSFRLILTHHQVQAAMPVVDSLAGELAKIAHKYPELSEYKPGSAKVLSERRVGLWYGHNFTPPRSKRGIEPSDFGEHGFHVRYVCAPKPSRWGPHYSMSPPARRLHNLCLYLWTEVETAPDPSAGLVEEVAALLRSHADKLKAIDCELYHGNLSPPEMPPGLRERYGRLSGAEIWKRVRKVILYFRVPGEEAELSEEEKREIVREMLPSLTPEQLLSAARRIVKEGDEWTGGGKEGRRRALMCLDFVFRHYPWTVGRATEETEGALPEVAPLLGIVGSREEPFVLRRVIMELLRAFRLTSEQEDEYAAVLRRMLQDREEALDLRLKAQHTLWVQLAEEHSAIVRSDPARAEIFRPGERYQFTAFTTVWLQERRLLPETREKLRRWREKVREMAGLFEEERDGSSDELFRQRIDGTIGLMQGAIRDPRESGLKGSPVLTSANPAAPGTPRTPALSIALAV